MNAATIWFRIPMCLAVPGKIVNFHDLDGVKMARVDFGGITREACLEYLPEAGIGDYVLVHAGFAISRISPEEAQRTYEYLTELAEAGDQDEVP